LTEGGRVAFLLKRDRPDAVELCRTLVDAVRGRGLSELVVRDFIDLPAGVASIPEGELAQVDDLRFLVVLGGDGTLLYGASLLTDGEREGSGPARTPTKAADSAGIPILGINLGHLGFLTCCAPEEAVVTLHAALDGHLPLEDRRRLRCRVLRQAPQGGDAGDVSTERTALNDVVFSQPNQARLSELEVFVDGDLVTTYRADGLIVATATGSTAYNLAAGGPILMPGMDAVVLSPICPHTLTARPLVTRLSSRILVRPGRSPSRNTDELLLTIDGQWTQRIGSSDVVEVTSDAPPVRIYRPPQRSFFDLLRTKLHWGIRS
jgi:NAD+ kinase